MRTDTGEIQEYSSEEELKKLNKLLAQAGEPQLAELNRRSKSNCPKCKGKGWHGRNKKTGLVKTCHCVYNGE